MFTISMKKLWKQSYYIHHKNNKMNNGNEKHPKNFLRNRFVQKFPLTVKRLLNMPTVARY